MPAIKLSGKPAGRTAPKRKPAAKATPKRKPAAKAAPTRKPAAKTAAAPAATNGAATRGPSGPKLPEGWTQRDFNGVVKEMQKAAAAKQAAIDKLAETQETVNALAVEMLSEGIQMSVVSTELGLSRQWMYGLLDAAGIVPPNSPRNKPATRSRSASRTSKPAAKKRPAAKSKPAAKRSAPARKRPAPAPAVTGRGRVRIAR